MASRRRMVDPRQLSLLLGDEPEENGPFDPSDSNGVFFAVMPPPAIAPRLVRFAEGQQHVYGLAGKPRPEGRLHFSLIGLGRHRDLPAQYIERAKWAASSVRMQAFVVELSELMSFKKEGNHPLVLCGDDGVVGIMNLYKALGAALVTARLIRHVPSDFTPHVTLLYDPKLVDRAILDAPFSWKVNEFALVHGRDRAPEFDYLGRWPLREGG
jgi:2'-5' RNA ligase